jgi:hypothetical protein
MVADYREWIAATISIQQKYFLIYRTVLRNGCKNLVLIDTVLNYFNEEPG